MMKDASIKSRIGFLPEESYLYPFLDAYETLEFYGKLFGLPSKVRKMRIESLLDMWACWLSPIVPWALFPREWQGVSVWRRLLSTILIC